MGTLTATWPTASSAAVTCNLYASPSGSDSNPGTSASPFATVQQLDNSLAAGQTGCLMSGTYGNSSTQNTFANSRGITITSYPGQTATVDGYPLITGAGTVLSNTNFDVNNVSDGTHCPGESQGAYSLQIEANNVTIQHDNIYQTDVPMSLRAVGIGVGWNSPVSGVVISNNRIHDFGHCQDLDHGIYVDQATGTQIFGNWIYNIPAGAGIQLYPHPQGSHVYSNIIDHAGIGFFLGDEAGSPAANNQIDHNVISNSTGLPSIGMGAVAISTYWGGSVGTGNTFTTNDSYNNSGGTTGSSNGVTITGTITTDPQYTSTTTNNYQIASTSPLATWGLWNGDQTVGSTPPTPAPVLTLPAVPSGISTTGANGQVTVKWAANAAGDQVTHYNVYRTDQTFTGPWATTTATTFTNAGSVVNGTQYCYQVSATNATGDSAESAAVCATPTPPPTTTTPTPTTPTPTTPTPTTPTPTTPTPTTPTPTTPTPTTPTPAPPTPAPPTTTVASVPSGLKAVASGTKVILTWKANPASNQVTHYNVYRTDQKFTRPWATTTATTFTNSGSVVTGKRYCYKLSATNPIGVSAKSTAVCVTVPRLTATAARAKARQQRHAHHTHRKTHKRPAHRR